MATTKVKPKSPAIAAAASLLATKVSEQQLLDKAALELLDAIEVRTDVLEPANLKLVPGELRLLKAGGVEFENLHELCQILRRTRCTREMREELGCLANIAKTKEKLAEAEEVLATYRAEAESLDVATVSTEPALVRQIERLADKLRELETARNIVKRRLTKFEGLLSQLKERCPEILREAIEAREQEFQQSEIVRQTRRLRDKLAGVERMLDPKNPNGFTSGHVDLHAANGTWLSYLKCHCPQALEYVGRSNHIKHSELEKHVQALRAGVPAAEQELVVLEQRYAEAERECKRDVDNLLDEWIATGKIDFV